MGMCNGPNFLTASALSGQLTPKARYKVQGLGSNFATRCHVIFPTAPKCVIKLHCEIQKINNSNSVDVFNSVTWKVRNVLSPQLRSSSISRGQFRAGLKTRLFTQAYGYHLELLYCCTLLFYITLRYICF